jgi:hypothetical protein
LLDRTTLLTVGTLLDRTALLAGTALLAVGTLLAGTALRTGTALLAESGLLGRPAHLHPTGRRTGLGDPPERLPIALGHQPQRQVALGHLDQPGGGLGLTHPGIPGRLGQPDSAVVDDLGEQPQIVGIGDRPSGRQLWTGHLQDATGADRRWHRVAHPVTRRHARRWIVLSVARARHGAGLRDGPQDE